jgi:hypothetical protein
MRFLKGEKIMSMCYGVETGYGLILFANEMQDFVKKLAALRGCAEEDALIDEGISELSYDNGYESWDAFYLASEGASNESDEGAFIYAKKQGGITKDTANLYASLDEMADEFHERYGNCLPSDFNYLAHLCYLRASYAC